MSDAEALNSSHVVELQDYRVGLTTVRARVALLEPSESRCERITANLRIGSAPQPVLLVIPAMILRAISGGHTITILPHIFYGGSGRI